MGSEGVRGWMVRGCAGSVQKCALEAGLHPGDADRRVTGKRAKMIPKSRISPGMTPVTGISEIDQIADLAWAKSCE